MLGRYARRVLDGHQITRKWNHFRAERGVCVG